MKKSKIGAIKLFFLFATLGVFPFLYPTMQAQNQRMDMNYHRSFDIRLTDKQVPLPVDRSLLTEKIDLQKHASNALVPIDPALGSEAKPDPIE